MMKNTKTVKETLSKQLLRLRKKTAWSWERMCREFHRVMGYEGPSHTTLFPGRQQASRAAKWPGRPICAAGYRQANR